MSRNWWSLSIRVLLILFVVMSVSHPAHAFSFSFWPFWPFTPPPPPPRNYISPVAAPEYDLRLAIEGLAVAGAAGALIWERIRRRR
jgi:hypothetical protein